MPPSVMRDWLSDQLLQPKVTAQVRQLIDVDVFPRHGSRRP